jgi:hypothetical protein
MKVGEYIMTPNEGVRTLAWVDTLYPLEQWRNVLSLGIHRNTFTQWRGEFWLDEIIEVRGNKELHLDLVEMNPVHIEVSRNSEPGKKYANYITYYESLWEDYLGGVSKEYDVVMWWHGPEHVVPSEFVRLVGLIEKHCTGLVIMACPEGHDPCWNRDVDPHFDEHLWEVHPEDFHVLGYITQEYDRPRNPRRARAISAVKDCRVGT